MGKPKDYTGQKFSRLLVIQRLRQYDGKNTFYKCKCDCGKDTIVDARNLTTGNTKSCGCFQQEQRIAVNTTHNGTYSKLYTIWCGMKARCYNPKCERYKNYGARGITICDEWLHDFNAFRAWAINNGYIKDSKSGEYTIDRIDINGNYEPNNCRFTNLKEQMNNTTRNRFIEYNGEIKTIAQWSDSTGINQSCLLRRLNSGWSIKKVLTTPIKKNKGEKNGK